MFANIDQLCQILSIGSDNQIKEMLKEREELMCMIRNVEYFRQRSDELTLKIIQKLGFNPVFGHEINIYNDRYLQINPPPELRQPKSAFRPVIQSLKRSSELTDSRPAKQHHKSDSDSAYDSKITILTEIKNVEVPCDIRGIILAFIKLCELRRKFHNFNKYDIRNRNAIQEAKYDLKKCDSWPYSKMIDMKKLYRSRVYSSRSTYVKELRQLKN